jgi:SAM-dependent methyltransferase
MCFPPSCPLCQASSDRLIHRKGPWGYYRCRACRIVFLFPRPFEKALEKAYQTYLPQSSEAIEAWRRSMAEVIAKSARLIEREVGRAGRILDVGCGFGFFLDCMNRRGWQAEGIEISAFGRAVIRQKFPEISVRGKALPDPALGDGTYEAVTLFYVLEHLADPISILKEVHRILKPGGVMLIRWPHSTPIVRLLGPLANRLDLFHTPFHLYDFSVPFFDRRLRVLGFQGIETRIAGRTRPPDLLGRWASTFLGGLGEFLSTWTRGKWLLPGVSKTTLARKPLDGQVVRPGRDEKPHLLQGNGV